MVNIKNILLKLFTCFSDKKPTEDQIDKVEQTEEWLNYVDQLVATTMTKSVKHPSDVV